MRRILIADDDRLLRTLLVRALQRADAAVDIIEAQDGKEAIAILEKEPVNLVITDIGMPRVNGLVVLAYLNAFLPEIPVFVMTAYGTSRLRAKLPPDLLRFYAKPFDVHDLARSALAAIEREVDPTVCQGVTLVRMLDLAGIEGLTCTLVVTGPSDQTCRLYLDSGYLIDAELDGVSGEAAAVEALSWKRSRYCIDYNLPSTVERRIHTSLDQLIRSVAECHPVSG